MFLGKIHLGMSLFMFAIFSMFFLHPHSLQARDIHPSNTQSKSKAKHAANVDARNASKTKKSLGIHFGPGPGSQQGVNAIHFGPGPNSAQPSVASLWTYVIRDQNESLSNHKK